MAPDLRRMKLVNSIILPILEVTKRIVLKLQTWGGQIDFSIVKMDDFGIVLRIEFLFKHKFIPMPLVKYLVIGAVF